MKMTHIVAYEIETRLIGASGDLPWTIMSDLSFFKDYTMDKIVIMGRKTFVSIPVFLRGRAVIVVTESPHLVDDHVSSLKESSGLEASEIYTVPNVSEALIAAEHLIKEANKPEEVIVAGGSSIYQQTMCVVDRIIATLVGLRIDDSLLDKVYYPCHSNLSVVEETLRPWEEDLIDGDNCLYSRLSFTRKETKIYDFKNKRPMTKLERFRLSLTGVQL